MIYYFYIYFTLLWKEFLDRFLFLLAFLLRDLYDLEYFLHRFPLLLKFKILNEDQIIRTLTPEEKTDLLEIRKYLLDTVKPEFEDLNIYYKLRVIIDFISGMTDQFALNHFQKISGQKI